MSGVPVGFGIMEHMGLLSGGWNVGDGCYGYDPTDPSDLSHMHS